MSTVPAKLTTPRLSRSSVGRARIYMGAGVAGVILAACLTSLPWTLDPEGPLYYDAIFRYAVFQPPQTDLPLVAGADDLGRSMLGRSLLGGAVSVAVGLCSAIIAVILGVSVGLLAGYRGGWTDSLLMRSVDVLYGLPYILLVILFRVAFKDPLTELLGNAPAANFTVMFLAIGLVSWMTMARVVRGQVLSLRKQPFIEAARALGLPHSRIFLRHLLPNLVGPIVVYATLIIPQAILQESFLSFLGLGIEQSLPTWGALASSARTQALMPGSSRWWLLMFPCTLLALMLLALNFLGDGLRDRFDPRRDQARI